MTLLRQVYELTEKALKEKEELIKQGRFDEVKILESNIKFQVNVILNGLDYKLILQ